MNVRAFLFGFCLVLVLSVSGVARADSGPYPTAPRTWSQAYENCQFSLTDPAAQWGNNTVPPRTCEDRPTQSQWVVMAAPYAGYPLQPYSCRDTSCSYSSRPVCTADDAPHPNRQWAGNIAVGSKECESGCYYEFRSNPGFTSLCFNAGSCSSWGYYRQTGEMCGTPTGAAPVPPSDPPKPCGGQSCYDPQHGYCAVTESGEQICTGDDPKPGTCITGATGAVCLGDQSNPPPTPPDPPIPPQRPPSSTDTATANSTDGSGNISSSTTIINNYNGSDTPQPSSGGSTGTGGLGGSSNGTGNGNSGDKGTDSNGKCPDGSVPTASGCSGTFSDADCDHPPACHGDAILCGIAAESQATRCNGAKLEYMVEHPGADLQIDPYDLGGDAGKVGETSKVQDLGDTSKLDASGFGYGGSCPAEDMTVPIGGSAFVVPFSKACEWGDLLRAFVLAFAYFGAAKIIAGVK